MNDGDHMNRRVIGLGARLRSAGALATLVLAAACGSDNGTGTGDTPATVVANSTPPASAVIASPVNPAPSVVVKNGSGAPLPNVRVTFVITAGDGQVSGASQLTDANGVATVGLWTLGTTVGPQALTATAGGKTVTFTVNATNTCALTGALEAGATVNGDLTASPCAMGDGTAAQSWTFTQATGQANVSFQMHPTGGSNFDTVLLLYRNMFSGYDKIVAFNDDDTTLPPFTTTDSRMDMILAPGSYVVSGVNYDAGVTGTFSITAASWSGEMSGCSDVFVTPGITTTQRMDSTCFYPNTNYQNADPVLVYMAQGQQVQFDMSSSAFDPALDLYGGTGAVAQDDNGGGGTSARIVYTAPASGIYQLVTTSRSLGQVGPYTLTVTSLSGGGSAPATSAAAGQRIGLRPWGGKHAVAPRLVSRR